MAHVPGLRSPYVKVGRLVYFGRMLDKIRLHAAGKLPVADYAANLGKGFDGRCCNFLRVNYDELKARTLAGGTDEEILACWGLIAVKHIAVIWAVHHYAVPFHQLWINVPTFVLGLLATLAYYGRE